jgi:hypothetical protein
LAKQQFALVANGDKPIKPGVQRAKASGTPGMIPTRYPSLKATNTVNPNNTFRLSRHHISGRVPEIRPRMSAPFRDEPFGSQYIWKRRVPAIARSRTHRNPAANKILRIGDPVF